MTGRRSAASLPTADLKMPRIILHAGQRGDFAPWWPCASTLGANPCRPALGKPTVATVLPSRIARLATTPDKSGQTPPPFRDCGIIGRIHLHHSGGVAF